MPFPLLFSSAPLLTAFAADLTLWLVDPSPEPEDVKAGWAAFALFLLLLVAVGLLGRSLVKQLRRAQAAKDAGAYGDTPVDPNNPADPGEGPDPR